MSVYSCISTFCTSF